MMGPFCLDLGKIFSERDTDKVREKIANLLQKSKKLLSSFKCSLLWSLRELSLIPHNKHYWLSSLGSNMASPLPVIKTAVSRVCFMTRASRSSGSIYESWTEHFCGIWSARQFLQLRPCLALWTPLNSLKTLISLCNLSPNDILVLEVKNSIIFVIFLKHLKKLFCGGNNAQYKYCVYYRAASLTR